MFTQSANLICVQTIPTIVHRLSLIPRSFLSRLSSTEGGVRSAICKQLCMQLHFGQCLHCTEMKALYSLGQIT